MLADRGFQASWLDTHRSSNRHQIWELQKLPHSQEFDTGGINGIAGPATRAAIGYVQAETGWIADGFPDPELLADLQQRQNIRTAGGNARVSPSTAHWLDGSSRPAICIVEELALIIRKSS